VPPTPLRGGKEGVKKRGKGATNLKTGSPGGLEKTSARASGRGKTKVKTKRGSPLKKQRGKLSHKKRG